MATFQGPESTPADAEAAPLPALEVISPTHEPTTTGIRAPKLQRFVASDPQGSAHEISFLAPTPSSPCLLGIRSLGSRSAWPVYQVEQHRGARHDAVVEVLLKVLEDFKHPETFEQALDYLDSLAATTMVQRHYQSADKRVPEPQLMSRETALRLLEQFNIPIETWGSNGSKSVELLLEEIERGECRLIIRDGQLVRYLDVVRVMVDHHAPTGECLRLVEARQVFPDGTERVRHVPFSVGEKTLRFETSYECLSRGLIEELGLRAVPIPVGGQMSAWEGECRDYPGLQSLKLFSDFRVEMPEASFRPEGYDEQNDKLRTEFRWVPLEGPKEK